MAVLKLGVVRVAVRITNIRGGEGGNNNIRGGEGGSTNIRGGKGGSTNIRGGEGGSTNIRGGEGGSVGCVRLSSCVGWTKWYGPHRYGQVDVPV